MGFLFVSGKKKKMAKLVRAYVKDRVKEKRAFEEQLERLDVQLQKKIIDPLTYERIKDVLEIGFVKQREEAREELTFFGR